MESRLGSFHQSTYLGIRYLLDSWHIWGYWQRSLYFLFGFLYTPLADAILSLLAP